MKFKTVMIVLVTALFSSVAIANESEVEDIAKQSYQCANSKSFEAIYINNNENNYAIVSYDKKMIPMKIFPMASGANYASVGEKQNYKLFTKGDNAELTTDKDVVILADCVAVSASIPK
nr:MliC family protein [uncultured Moellerella sp.]